MGRVDDEEVNKLPKNFLVVIKKYTVSRCTFTY